MPIWDSKWWQGPFAWSCAVFAFIISMTAIPNCQFGYIKYDKKTHIGIGAWKVCSNMYTKHAMFADNTVAWTEGAKCRDFETFFLEGGLKVIGDLSVAALVFLCLGIVGWMHYVWSQNANAMKVTVSTLGLSFLLAFCSWAHVQSVFAGNAKLLFVDAAGIPQIVSGTLSDYAHMGYGSDYFLGVWLLTGCSLAASLHRLLQVAFRWYG